MAHMIDLSITTMWKLSSTKGLTLIELTIVITLLTIIIVPLTMFFGSSVRTYFTGSPPPRVKQVLYEATTEVSDYLRESPGITNINSNSVSFLTADGSSSITFATNSSRIIRTQGTNSTFVPYYNVSGGDNINLTLTFNWVGSSPGEITALNLTLTGSYANYNLTMNNTVKLRGKN